MGSFFNRRASDKRKAFSKPDPKDMPQGIAKDINGSASLHNVDLIIPAYEEQEQLSVAHAAAPVQKDISTQKVKPKTRNAKIVTTDDTPKVIALIGASGGVGTTSLAAQIAYELSLTCRDKNTDFRYIQDPQVCLIDLDFEGGSCAYHLDILPNLSVEDLTGDASQIDTTFTTSLTSTHECGISLLAVLNTPQAHQVINPHAVMALLDAASQLYRYVIIDMPRYSQSWTPAVIGGSDFVGIVSELTVSSLHMARDKFNQTSKGYAYEDMSNCHAILNKYERRSFKNTLRVKDAKTVLGRNVISTICIDTDTCREAINCGQPIGAVRPDSRYVKDTRQLIKDIWDSCEMNENVASRPSQLHKSM